MILEARHFSVTYDMAREIEQTDKTRFRRLPKRGAYDCETIYSILDEAFICHVGFAVEGQPYVIPTGFARIGTISIFTDHRPVGCSEASQPASTFA